ncbi:TetR-like C-terminal domain-containing protein [Alteribacillus bidgolensis]|uniref:Transcriptional regulator C-terminal region n=1 Tax=Alteribacillus bidgolensis TaxID=930129 RepID=A0A1G8CS73_9BACI|nr:TetR-like C-terminal domain-containing protein [Alteribacillus bidgolensis]SDH48292.1 Transcriptional regulator C-terminal region [Alteribacillus bidgolensis]
MQEQVSNKLSALQIDEEQMLVPRDYLITFVISAQLGIIQHWIETDLQRSPEEVAAIITRIASRGPLGAISIEEQELQGKKSRKNTEEDKSAKNARFG